MARPMLLMPYSLLRDMAKLNKQGVPLCKLIKLHKLELTHPTLSKMIEHYNTMLSVMNNTSKDSPYDMMHDSLFPSWLPIDGAIMKQPEDWFYTGKFPLGKWQRREDNVQS